MIASVRGEVVDIALADIDYDAYVRAHGTVLATNIVLSVDARAKAKEWFDQFPKAAYWTEVESWRQLDGDQIEFTMRRLPSAD